VRQRRAAALADFRVLADGVLGEAWGDEDWGDDDWAAAGLAATAVMLPPFAVGWV
jgi:hypothetical protein